MLSFTTLLLLAPSLQIAGGAGHEMPHHEGDAARRGLEATVFRLAPFLILSAGSISAASGGILRAELAFPPDAAGCRFHLLASASGPGPVFVNGVPVALTPDGVTRKTLWGALPGVGGRLTGTLDGRGRGTAAVKVPPRHLDPLVGRTLHVVALALEPGRGTVRYSSFPWALTVHP